MQTKVCSRLHTTASRWILSSFLVVMFVISYQLSDTLLSNDHDKGVTNRAGIHHHQPQPQPQPMIASPSTNTTKTAATTATTTATTISKSMDAKYSHYPNTTTDPNCQFQNNPTSESTSTTSIPVILLSYGRSGSSVTWNTISKLLGQSTRAYEITGNNQDKSKYFFDHIQDASWPIHKLCEIQWKNIPNYDDRDDNNNNNLTITGFQWKPFRYSLAHPMGKAGLQSIANHTNPQIKVLYLYRNPLDQLISNLKHKGFVRSDNLPPHCAIEDEECIEEHRSHSKVTITIQGKELVNRMSSAMWNRHFCLDLLRFYGIPYHSMTYEDLYSHEENGESIKSWIELFDFLGKGPVNLENYHEELTMKHIHDTFPFAKTSPKRHEDIINNYEEVKKTLEDAGMGYLLH